MTRGTVVRINDGDTIQVQTDQGTQHIRLLGINAPDRDECFYDEAAGYLTETVGDAVVDLDIRGTDQFDRTLAYVWSGPEMVNLTLVASGLAIATTGDNDVYVAALLEAEQLSFDDELGLWAPGACDSSTTRGTVGIDLSRSVTDPPGPDDAVLSEEFIVITNQSNTTIDLEGWTVRDESSVNRLTFENVKLRPNESYKVVSDDPHWMPGGRSVWNNGGDQILVLDPDGAVVARRRYAPGR